LVKKKLQFPISITANLTLKNEYEVKGDDISLLDLSWKYFDVMGEITADMVEKVRPEITSHRDR